MDFVKMHGLGNDFVFIEDKTGQDKDYTVLARAMCNRHTGIGADGLIVIVDSRVADVRMRIINSDGSEAEMCGNGVRCVGKYVYDNGLTEKKKITVETGVRSEEEEKSGKISENRIKILDLTPENGKIAFVTVDMGIPETVSALIPVISDKETVINEPFNIAGKIWSLTCISMGNPHAVTFTDEVKSLDLHLIGPAFENNKIFPNRTNTEFIRVINRNELEMRVWERGSGETFACGTGACAAAYAAILNGYTDDEVTVHLLGGDLIIRLDREIGHIFMSGTAITAFEGRVLI